VNRLRGEVTPSEYPRAKRVASSQPLASADRIGSEVIALSRILPGIIIVSSYGTVLYCTTEPQERGPLAFHSPVPANSKLPSWWGRNRGPRDPPSRCLLGIETAKSNNDIHRTSHCATSRSTRSLRQFKLFDGAALILRLRRRLSLGAVA
jgi:hypothetical protein